MKKLLFLAALTFIGCDNYTQPQEPKVIEKKVIVHDTITKYRTHECSKEYGVEATKVKDQTFVFEIRNKKTDDLVFYIEPLVIRNNIKKAGGKLETIVYDMCKHNKKEHIISCEISAENNEEQLYFYKTWPDSDFYIIETLSAGVDPAVLTVKFLPPLKGNWD